MRPYIDLHCDTLEQAFLAGRPDICRFEGAMVDLERLERGGCFAQFFSMFMLPDSQRAALGDRLPGDDAYIRGLHEILVNTIDRSEGRLALTRSYAELEKNRAEGRISAFLTIEGGRPVEGSMERLEEFFDLGVRLITLTWNYGTCFGAPNSRDPAVMSQGLTPFGKDAVRRMNELGMLVDVSHLSDGGFRDVLDVSQKPFTASHSNCRALNPHPRSMTDEMIRALADRGGVMGVNFFPGFLTEDPENTDSTVEMLLAHLRHMIDVGGVGCAAIGTDFDGIEGRIELDGAQKMPRLFEAMERAGFTSTEIDAVAEKNALRLLRDVMPQNNIPEALRTLRDAGPGRFAVSAASKMPRGTIYNLFK